GAAAPAGAAGRSGGRGGGKGQGKQSREAFRRDALEAWTKALFSEAEGGGATDGTDACHAGALAGRRRRRERQPRGRPGAGRVPRGGPRGEVVALLAGDRGDLPCGGRRAVQRRQGDQRRWRGRRRRRRRRRRHLQRGLRGAPRARACWAGPAGRVPVAGPRSCPPPRLPRACAEGCCQSPSARPPVELPLAQGPSLRVGRDADAAARPGDR
ncbi:unnamed protein product, partial [Prorocentrum cordatum]